MRLSLRALLVPAMALALVPLTSAHSQAPLPPLPLLSAPAPAPSATSALAPVHLSLSSTSDWSVVRLTGARVVDLRVRSTSDGARLEVSDGTFGLRPPAGGAATAEIDAVLAVPAQDATLSVEKGWQGAAQAALRAGSAAPITVASITHSSSAQAATTVPQRTLAGAAARPPRADTRRLVLAFYYPWFSSYDDWRLAEKPANPRPASDPAGVLSMTEQAHRSGVDGFLVSWSGAQRDGAGYDLAMQAAERTGSLVAPYLETGELATDNPSKDELARRVRTAVSQALDRSGSAAALRADGVPVVFAIETDRLSADTWRQMLADFAAEGRPMRLVGDARDGYLAAQWGFHRYGATQAPDQLAAQWVGTAEAERAADLLDGTQHLVTATVSPGYDDRRMRGLLRPSVPRDGGARYDATWRAALAADPDWVLVTSWNEWYEGTSIEPGAQSGSTALDQTRGSSASWKAR